MKKNFNVPLNELNGETVLRDKKEVFIRNIVTEALMGHLPNDNATGEQKFKRFQLATKINTDEISVEITPEEAVMIKDVVGKMFNPLVVGQVYTLLNE